MLRIGSFGRGIPALVTLRRAASIARVRTVAAALPSTLRSVATHAAKATSTRVTASKRVPSGEATTQKKAKTKPAKAASAAKKAKVKAKKTTKTAKKKKKKVAKPLTEEQKQKKAAKETRSQIKHLTDELSSAPQPPKRPTPAYMRFISEQYPVLAAQVTPPGEAASPDAKQQHFLMLSREVAARWKSLDTATRDAYKHRYDQEMAEYEQTRRDWIASLTPAQVVAWNKRVMLKTKARSSALARSGTVKAFMHRVDRIHGAVSPQPKRPGSPFVEFVRDMSPEERRTHAASGPERMREWKRQFDALHESEKDHLRQRNKEAWARYNEEMTAWRASVKESSKV